MSLHLASWSPDLTDFVYPPVLADPAGRVVTAPALGSWSTLTGLGPPLSVVDRAVITFYLSYTRSHSFDVLIQASVIL